MTGSGNFVCWGEVLWDFFDDSQRLGGAPSNVAYHLARLRQPAALVSRVGDDPLGHEARKLLADHGVDIGAVQIDSEHPTGRVTVELEGGEPRYVLHADCAWERIACNEAAQKLLASARAFYYGTLSQRSPAGAQSLDEALSQLPESCSRVYDVNLRPLDMDLDLIRRLLLEANIVKVNEGEAATLEGKLGVDDLVRWLFADGRARFVALTRGERGSALHTPDATHEGAPFPAEAGGDNVGAGDAFTAMLITGILAGSDLATIASAANRYAAFVASRAGATPDVPAALVDDLVGAL